MRKEEEVSKLHLEKEIERLRGVVEHLRIDIDKLYKVLQAEQALRADYEHLKTQGHP